MATPDISADQARRVENAEWKTGKNIWRVGFCLDSLNLISLLSGLVDIKATVYDRKENVLVFIVDSLDRSQILFRMGFLKANAVMRYRLVDQPLLVETSAEGPGPFVN